MILLTIKNRIQDKMKNYICGQISAFSCNQYINETVIWNKFLSNQVKLEHPIVK